MRALFWLLTLAALAVGLALAARYNEGYVLLVLPPWRAEVSLNLFILAAIAGFFLIYLLARAASHVLALPRAVAEFRARRQQEQAALALRDAWRLLQEGRYGHAVRRAEKIRHDHPGAGMLALAGWRAAHALRDAARSADWAARVRSHDASGMQAARLMTEAEFALEDRRFDDARNALQQFAVLEGKHIAAMRLSVRAEQGLGNWREVARLVRQLEKHQALTADQAAPIRSRAVREALRGLRDDPVGLMRYWRELDEGDRAEPALALETARALMGGGRRLPRSAARDRGCPGRTLGCRAGAGLRRMRQAGGAGRRRPRPHRPGRKMAAAADAARRLPAAHPRPLVPPAATVGQGEELSGSRACRHALARRTCRIGATARTSGRVGAGGTPLSRRCGALAAF
jgi:HemY protein